MEDWAKRRLAELKAAAPKKRAANKKKKYAYVPLPWGYRALTVAGRGAAIVAHALHIQKTEGHGDVEITAKLLKELGIDRKTRSRTIERLVQAGLATSRRRGKKFRGCPLLTMLVPK